MIETVKVFARKKWFLWTYLVSKNFQKTELGVRVFEVIYDWFLFICLLPFLDGIIMLLCFVFTLVLLYFG